MGNQGEQARGKTQRQASTMMQYAKDMIDQFEKKNEAYGDSFGRSFREYGEIAALVRMGDKFHRIQSLFSGANKKVADESVKDTLIDLAYYCLMTVFELEERENKNYTSTISNTSEYFGEAAGDFLCEVLRYKYDESFKATGKIISADKPKVVYALESEGK